MNTGTKEWAEQNRNICLGCSNNCLYCYGREYALRYKRISAPEEWPQMRLNHSELQRKPYRMKSRCMFPSTHDIVPQILDATIQYLEGWLEAGNEFLIVSKPHLECIQRIIHDLARFKWQIIFRFTIGSINSRTLKFWEPGAPSFEERFECLKYADSMGWTTSVSCEPYLDSDIFETVNTLLPYVTETLWVGKMNKIRERIDTSNWGHNEHNYLRRVLNSQTDEAVKRLYGFYKSEEKIRWKDQHPQRHQHRQERAAPHPLQVLQQGMQAQMRSERDRFY